MAQFKHYLVHTYFWKVSDSIREEYMGLPYKVRMKTNTYAAWHHFLIDTPGTLSMSRLNIVTQRWSPFR